MNIKILSKIAAVTGGYTFRGAIKSLANGDTFVLQAKDIDEGIVIDIDLNLAKVEMGSRGNMSILQPGDIVITNRASHAGSFVAALFNDHTRRVIASISLHVIRANTDLVLPEYLVSFFNSSQGQSLLQNISKGAVVQSLSIQELRKLSIPMPHIEVQQAIVGLSNITQEQQRLLSKKITYIESIKNAAIIKAIQ